MAIYLIALLVFLLFVITIIVLTKLQKFKKKAKKMLRRIIVKIFWNNTIRSITISYLDSLIQFSL